MLIILCLIYTIKYTYLWFVLHFFAFYLEYENAKKKLVTNKTNCVSISTCVYVYNIFVYFYVTKFYQFILTSKLPFINLKLNNFEYLFLQTRLVFQQLHFVKSILDKFLNAVSHNTQKQVYGTDNLTNIDAVKLYLSMWYHN